MKLKNPNLKNKAGIYFIVNSINRKVYVGSAVNLEQRWAVHRFDLNKNQHHSPYLQRSWNKHGPNNFEFIYVEFVKDIAKLREREQHWIELANCCNPTFGYNTNPNAYNSSGYKHTNEAKLKISVRNKEMGIKPPSPLGKKRSPETCLAISKATTGIKKSTTEKMKKPKSEAHKLALSLSKKGSTLSLEHRINIGIGGREPDKWPCPDGSKCKCSNCRKKRNAYYRAKKYKRKEVNVNCP